MRNIFAPFGFGMESAGIQEHVQLAVFVRSKGEADGRASAFGVQQMGIGGKMIFGAAVALGFLVEISVFDVETDRQGDVGVGGQRFADAEFSGKARELENNGARKDLSLNWRLGCNRIWN